MSTAPMPSRPGTAFWRRAPQALEIATLVVVALALLVQAVMVVLTADSLGGGVAFLLAVTSVILIRKSRYYPALFLAAAAPLAAALLGWDPIGSWSIACFLAFLLALRALPGLVAGAVIGAANLVASVVHVGTLLPSSNPGASIAAFAAFVMAAGGSAIRGHRKYWSELEQRTAQALATREAAVNRGIAEERVRIARDLHDSVGHKIAVVNMHLGAAEVHLPAGADAAQADLGAARAAVQAVLRETQEILRILRLGSEGATLDPTPGHELIPELLTSFRDAGMTIEATLPADVPSLAPGGGAAVYRIVQESLTNAQKYGTGAVSLRVEVEHSDTLVIEVVNVRTDSGRRRGAVGGNGIIGMRERAAAAGGTLQVRSEGQLFWMRATVPVDGSAPGTV